MRPVFGYPNWNDINSTSGNILLAQFGTERRLNNHRNQYKGSPAEGYTWKELIAKAHTMDVDLCTHYWLEGKKSAVGYFCYGACSTEATIDVLT